jgi:hypothetical protein
MSEPLWIVVLMFGQVVRAMGPLPFDDAQCTRQLAELSGQMDQKYEADKFLGNKYPQIKGRIVERSDLTVECRHAESEPPVELNPD